VYAYPHFPSAPASATMLQRFLGLRPGTTALKARHHVMHYCSKGMLVTTAIQACHHIMHMKMKTGMKRHRVGLSRTIYRDVYMVYIRCF
jgi:hypothetical protein